MAERMLRLDQAGDAQQRRGEEVKSVLMSHSGCTNIVVEPTLL